MIQNFHGHTGDVFAIDMPKSDTGNTFISAGADKVLISLIKIFKLKIAYLP